MDHRYILEVRNTYFLFTCDVHTHVELILLLLYLQPSDGLQLFLEIQEFDLGTGTPSPDLIDRFAVELNTTVGYSSERETFFGMFNFSTVDLSYRADCTKYFSGPNCVDPCVGIDCQTCAKGTCAVCESTCNAATTSTTTTNSTADTTSEVVNTTGKNLNIAVPVSATVAGVFAVVATIVLVIVVGIIAWQRSRRKAKRKLMSSEVVTYSSHANETNVTLTGTSSSGTAVSTGGGTECGFINSTLSC